MAKGGWVYEGRDVVDRGLDWGWEMTTWGTWDGLTEGYEAQEGWGWERIMVVDRMIDVRWVERHLNRLLEKGV